MFVAPTLVGEVRYGSWTADGRLRHPSWRGLRPDKSPGEVVREEGGEPVQEAPAPARGSTGEKGSKHPTGEDAR